MNRISLFFDVKIDPAEFARLVADLGGVAWPNAWTEARLTRGGGRSVWADHSEKWFRGLGAADRTDFAAQLGAEICDKTDLYISSARGSDHVALDIIEAAAKRWHFIVYDHRGNTCTVDELRARADTNQPFLFVPEPSRPRMGDSVHLLCADPVGPDDLVELAEAQGGVPYQNDDAFHAAVWRSADYVWARAVAAEPRVELGTWWSRECAEHLGAPVRGMVELAMPRERGADRLALEVIEAAAERWNCVVVDCWDLVSTAVEVRHLAATDPWYLFVPETWRSRLADSDAHTLAFAEPVEPERFLDLMDSLGAVRDPDGWTDAHLSEQDAHAWIAARPEYQLDCLRSLLEYEEKLGGPFANVMTLHTSRSAGGERLRRLILHEAARHWRLVVDDGRGDIAVPGS
jgi:hypothetical protein